MTAFKLFDEVVFTNDTEEEVIKNLSEEGFTEGIDYCFVRED